MQAPNDNLVTGSPGHVSIDTDTAQNANSYLHKAFNKDGREPPRKEDQSKDKNNDNNGTNNDIMEIDDKQGQKVGEDALNLVLQNTTPPVQNWELLFCFNIQYWESKKH